MTTIHVFPRLGVLGGLWRLRAGRVATSIIRGSLIISRGTRVAIVMGRSPIVSWISRFVVIVPVVIVLVVVIGWSITIFSISVAVILRSTPMVRPITVFLGSVIIVASMSVRVQGPFSIPIPGRWTVVLPRAITPGLDLTNKGNSSLVKHIVFTLLYYVQPGMIYWAVWRMRAFHG